MRLSKSEIRKNRSVALAVALTAFSLLLLTFFLKKIFPEPVSRESASLMFSVSQEAGESAAQGGSGEVNKGASPQNKNAEVKSQLTEKESLISSYKNFKQQTAVSESPAESEIPGNETKGNTPFQGKEGKEQFSADLKGRVLESMPKIPAGPNAEGTVVVDIMVNQDGMVMEADPNGRGTSTTNAELKAIARKLALSAKFSSSTMENQRGTITITFVFN
jgi:outer membrane biosynthesis protein TonB